VRSVKQHEFSFRKERLRERALTQEWRDTCRELIEKKELASERGSHFVGVVFHYKLFSLVEAVSALEGLGDAWAYIGRADVTFELGLLHQLGGLFAGTAEQQ
jgi:hypothetical protein